jgi:hypothetical protein
MPRRRWCEAGRRRGLRWAWRRRAQGRRRRLLWWLGWGVHGVGPDNGRSLRLQRLRRQEHRPSEKQPAQEQHCWGSDGAGAWAFCWLFVRVPCVGLQRTSSSSAAGGDVRSTAGGLSPSPPASAPPAPSHRNHAQAGVTALFSRRSEHMHIALAPPRIHPREGCIEGGRLRVVAGRRWPCAIPFAPLDARGGDRPPRGVPPSKPPLHSPSPTAAAESSTVARAREPSLPM